MLEVKAHTTIRTIFNSTCSLQHLTLRITGVNIWTETVLLNYIHSENINDDFPQTIRLTIFTGLS
jgi:hypothetical protein